MQSKTPESGEPVTDRRRGPSVKNFNQLRSINHIKNHKPCLDPQNQPQNHKSKYVSTFRLREHSSDVINRLSSFLYLRSIISELQKHLFSPKRLLHSNRIHTLPQCPDGSHIEPICLYGTQIQPIWLSIIIIIPKQILVQVYYSAGMGNNLNYIIEIA